MTATIAKDDLLEWQSLSGQAAQLQQQLSTIRARIGRIEDSCREALESSGKNTIKRHGFTLAWVAGRATIAWAKEFLDMAGPEKTQKIKDLAAESAPKKLVISPPSETE